MVHCVKNEAKSIMVQVRDIAVLLLLDVLLLLVAHLSQMTATKVWLKGATSTKQQKYISVHAIVDQLPYWPAILSTILAFLAVTGSDSTYYFI